MFFLLPRVGSLVDNRAYFALYPGGTSSLKQTPVPLAAYSSRTVYVCPKQGLIHPDRESSILRLLLYLQATTAGSMYIITLYFTSLCCNSLHSSKVSQSNLNVRSVYNYVKWSYSNLILNSVLSPSSIDPFYFSKVPIKYYNFWITRLFRKLYSTSLLSYFKGMKYKLKLR